MQMSVILGYINKLADPRQRAELKRLYDNVKSIAPDAEEGFGYGVPAFKYNGHFFMGFAANKKFLSLYPASDAIKTLKNDLKSYEISAGSGAIRFTPDNPLTEDLIKKITTIRLKDFGR